MNEINQNKLNNMMKKLIKEKTFNNLNDLLRFCQENEILIVGKKNKKFIEDIVQLENGEIQYTYDDCYSRIYTTKSYKHFISKIMFFEY